MLSCKMFLLKGYPTGGYYETHGGRTINASLVKACSLPLRLDTFSRSHSLSSLDNS